MIAVGCDPSSKHLALAAQDPKAQDWLVDKIPMPKNQPDAEEVMNWLSMVKIGSGPFHFICEQQFLRHGKKANVKTTIMLAAARGRIEAWAMAMGYKVHPALDPNSWQIPTLGIRPYSGVRSEQRKEAALRVASAIAGYNVTDKDIADAICISHWFRGRLETEARFEQQRR